MRSTLLICCAILSVVHGVRRLPNDYVNYEEEDTTNEQYNRRLQYTSQQRQEKHRNRLNTIKQSFRRRAESISPNNDDGPDSHLVTSMPLLPDGLLKTKHWAGHLPASIDGDKGIFYWLFEPGEGAANIPDNQIPLILWLNGGPGCSSMDGLWLENGPLRLQLDGNNKWTIGINEHSWHNAPAYTLYVDQPVGTGLSYSKKGNYCKNDFEVNKDFHYFLEEFFTFHADKFLTSSGDGVPAVLNRPFYFSGESHAGHYIPSMIDFIMQRNDGNLFPTESNGLQPLRVNIPISGAAIGNGWISPYHQYSAADAAYGAGLIGSAQRTAFEEKEKQCQAQLKSGNYRSSICFNLLDDIIDQSAGSSGNTKVSQYDTRLWEVKGAARQFPFGHKDVETYLGCKDHGQQPSIGVDCVEVLQAIHATESIDAGQKYLECTDPPYLALMNQDGLGVVDELVRILDHPSKPHMLFFNGMNDLICNHVGNEELLDALPWSKTSQYVQQPRHAWESGVDTSFKVNYTPGRPDGYIKQFENLSYLKVVESGHMVPMDQPAVSLAMMQTLVYGGTSASNNGFLTSMQNLDRATDDNMMCKCAE